MCGPEVLTTCDIYENMLFLRFLMIIVSREILKTHTYKHTMKCVEGQL